MQKFIQGYLDQISNTLILRTAITNKKKDEYKKIYSSLSQLKRRNFTTKESEIMKRKYKINLSQSCYAIESTRIRLGSKIFHSRNYNRKINCNSYTISFQSENKVEFGEILYLIEYKNKIFAKLNVYLELKNDTLPEKIGGYFCDCFEKLFQKFYSLVDIDKCYEDMILVDEIKYKCIMISYMKNLFHITNVVYDYEHD